MHRARVSCNQAGDARLHGWPLAGGNGVSMSAATVLFLKAWVISPFGLFPSCFKNNFFGGRAGSDQTYTLSLMT